MSRLPAEPEDLASWKRDLEREARYLGEIVSPLVIEDDGTVTPLRYGFARRFAFGNLHQERLASMTARWIASQAGFDYGALMTQGYDYTALANSQKSTLSNLYNMPEAWQNPRTVRFQVRVTF